jgi:hypothetical protein
MPDINIQVLFRVALDKVDGKTLEQLTSFNLLQGVLGRSAQQRLDASNALWWEHYAVRSPYRTIVNATLVNGLVRLVGQTPQKLFKIFFHDVYFLDYRKLSHFIAP